MLNVNVVPGFESLAAGVNEYDAPTATLVAGVPEITGAVFVTAIENAASETVACPSLTLITMPFVVPMWAAVGVPCKEPVVVLNVAHAGVVLMLNVSVVPAFGSLAVGVNEYGAPATTLVGGAPEMLGGAFGTAIAIEKGGNARVE